MRAMIQNLDYWGGELYFDNGRKTLSLGRNGQFKCIGVDLYYDYADSKLLISGLNTRGGVSRGHIRVPKEDIPELIEMLKRVYEIHSKARPIPR